MKTFVIKTATALTLGTGLAVSGLASAENWTTHLDQVRADIPTQAAVGADIGSGENYQHFLSYVQAHGPSELSRAEVLIGENYRPHIEAVRSGDRVDETTAQVTFR